MYLLRSFRATLLFRERSRVLEHGAGPPAVFPFRVLYHCAPPDQLRSHLLTTGSVTHSARMIACVGVFSTSAKEAYCLDEHKGRLREAP